jgi:hypothetical protein
MNMMRAGLVSEVTTTFNNNNTTTIQHKTLLGLGGEAMT